MAIKGKQRFFYAEVVRTARISPSLVRVVFGGDGLADYASNGAADECVSLYFPGEGEDKPPSMIEKDGEWAYRDIDEPEHRNYTVRSWDAAAKEMSIDFVAHKGGIAATWALTAAPGDVIGLWGPRGWYDPPSGTAWQLLVADLTGLPGLSRAVEELPAGFSVRAIVEVLDNADKVAIETNADLSITWLIGGNGRGPSGLGEALRAEPLPDGPGYVWFAGEAATSRDARKYLRNERGFASAQIEIIGYWRVRAEEWLQKYEAVEDRLHSEYQRLIDAGIEEAEAENRWEDMLEEAGL
ncbi:NADPH-dependent ferric siderophore reductase [Williamsia sp. 1138]|uniref:siderophore-interacting protein n=1 Tax=Williamsia sp. 1138 TaxID=1903117 RepID=UPI000A113B55|nr:siderophore-interacting protein [Williamsia sp. 1138]OZG29242.1 NADPH-dependent ferric siderophore reductase [Williamsia sp. 1138]